MIAALASSLVIAIGGGYNNIKHCTLTYAPTAYEWYVEHSMGVGYKTCTFKHPVLRRGLR